MPPEDGKIEREEFLDSVELALRDQVGETSVSRNYRINSGIDTLDFRVSGNLSNFAIEVALTVEELYTAVGRVQMYSEPLINSIPTVIVPCETVERELMHLAQQNVLLLEISKDYGDITESEGE